MDNMLGEIRAFAGNYAPEGWAICNGSLLPISGNETLYSLLGTIYGGDGSTNFGLPDLRGRMVVNQGQGTGLSQRALGSSGGTETVTLIASQLPSHNHQVMASSAAANTLAPNGALLAAPQDTTTTSNSILFYLPNTYAQKTIAALDPSTVGSTGGNLPHENRMPYVPISYIIALTGIYPSRP